MGKSNRIRANRSQQKVATPVKVNKKKGMPSWLMSLIAIAITIAVLLTVVTSILSSNGVFLRMRKGVETENYSFSGSMMSYLYHQAYQSFQTNYSSYLSYFSLDTSKSLKNQMFGAEGGYEASYLGAFDGTWYDYFMTQAENSAKQILIYCEEANARGLSLDNSDTVAIETELLTLELTASTQGYSVSQYITAMFGNGVKVKDVKKVLELTALASKGMNAVQEEILEGILDADIKAAYEADKDKYDVIDYMYYTMSVTYDSVAKELLGNDYTSAELNEKKDEVDAKYNEKVDEIKKLTEELESITDKDEFIKKILKHTADGYYDTKYDSLKLEEADLPDEETIALVKKALITKVVSEVMEGKTETTGDSTSADGKYTVYDYEVSEKFAKGIDTVKTAVFSSVSSDMFKYSLEKVSYSSTSDFSKWAFEAGREVGEIKTILDDEKPEEKYTSSVYMLNATRRADSTKTKNIAYMLFGKEEDANTAIEALKKETLTLEVFEESANKLSATGVSKLEEYIEGSVAVDGLDEWAYSDEIKLGDLTPKAIELDESTYMIAYYYEEGDETWNVTVKGDIFNERYEDAYEDMSEKYAPVVKASTSKKVSDGYLPIGLR